MTDPTDESTGNTSNTTPVGTHNVATGPVVGSVVQAGQIHELHIHVWRRLRLLLGSAGSNYLIDAHYEPDEDTTGRREELAERIARLAMDHPDDLHAAISEPADAAVEPPEQPWLFDEAIKLLTLVEQRLSEQRIAQQAHTDVAERMAVELTQLRLQVTSQLNTPPPTVPAADDKADLQPAPGECPYPGLSAFASHQAQWFFGREELTAKLLQRLTVVWSSGMPLFVIGVSGAGKSSLLRAGLFPALIRGDLPVSGSAGWPHVQLRPGAQPLHELVARTALLADIPAGGALADVRKDPARFAALVHQAAVADAKKRHGDHEPRCVVLIVDQLEEIFTHCTDSAERAAFVTALRAAAERAGKDKSAPRALVILGLRADFYPSCADEPDLAGILQDNQFLVGPMNSTELRSTIERPAAAVGLTVEPGLADLMLSDLGGAAGYQPGALPLLGFSLATTWTKRRGHTMTLASYQESGGVRGAIATAAETMFTALSESKQRTTRRLLLRLVAVGDGVEDTRRRVRKEELTDGSDDTETVLDRLVSTRLVTVSEDNVEIAHEALRATEEPQRPPCAHRSPRTSPFSS